MYTSDAEVAEPAGLCTVTGPEVTPAGTVAVSAVAVAEVTVSAVPLSRTTFSLAVAENPCPVTEIVPVAAVTGGTTASIPTGSSAAAGAVTSRPATRAPAAEAESTRIHVRVIAHPPP